MPSYETILVAVDGSDHARTAAGQAVRLANAFDASVTGVHAVEEPSSAVFAPDVETEPSLDEATEDAIEHLKMRAAAAAVPCETTVEQGTPHDVIESVADRIGADLVAMGTHGRTGLDRLLIGSVADRTLRTSDVPVLTTPDHGEETAYDSVLTAIDGSDPSAAAADRALAVADRFDATLHVLSVVRLQARAHTHGAGGITPSIVESVTERHETLVEEVADRADERGIDTVTSVPAGMPAPYVRDHVEDHDIDFVTIGTHGHTGLKRHLLGSVAERVVRTTPAPVMAVPP